MGKTTVIERHALDQLTNVHVHAHALYTHVPRAYSQCCGITVEDHGWPAGHAYVCSKMVCAWCVRDDQRWNPRLPARAAASMI